MSAFGGDLLGMFLGGGSQTEPDPDADGISKALGVKPGNLPPKLLVRLGIALFGRKLPPEYRERWLEETCAEVLPWLDFIGWDEVCGALDPSSLTPAMRLILCLFALGGGMWVVGNTITAEFQRTPEGQALQREAERRRAERDEAA